MIKTNTFFRRLNNEFANISQKVRSFRSIVFQWAFIRGWYFAEKCLKNGQNRGRAFIRAWTFIIDFMVYYHIVLAYFSIFLSKTRNSHFRPSGV